MRGGRVWGGSVQIEGVKVKLAPRFSVLQPRLVFLSQQKALLAANVSDEAAGLDPGWMTSTFGLLQPCSRTGSVG